MVEQVEGGVRKYITQEQLATVKHGETYSLDRGGSLATDIVEFDGFGLDGCYRWKRTDGRVFIYTAEQCQRLIYVFVPSRALVAESIADDFFEPTSGEHSRLRDAISKLVPNNCIRFHDGKVCRILAIQKDDQGEPLSVVCGRLV